MKKGVKVDQTLIYTKEGYPLSCTNGMFMKASYTQNGLDHILYMIYIIDKHNEGIQLYLDRTKDLGEQYDKELIAAIRSLKEE